MNSERPSPGPGALLALVALALGACATPRPDDPLQAERAPLYDQRAERLLAQESWTLDGRLAVNDGDQGGSGRLQWRQAPEGSRLDFHGALGRGAWRLTVDPGGAELAFATGERYRADSVNELIRDQVGWSVPVQPLTWWVRGLAAPGRVESRQLDADGTLSSLHQDGWKIEFSRYLDVAGTPMPARLTARSDQRTVKLAVKRWSWPATPSAAPD